jgi:DNA-binding transcriptional ArsR family regulator
MVKMTAVSSSNDMIEKLFINQADFCSIFRNSIRLKILCMLGFKERSVGEMSERLEVSMSNISQHLRIMKDRGIISSRKEGQRIFYRITNEKFLSGPAMVRSGLIEIYGLDENEVIQALEAELS